MIALEHFATTYKNTLLLCIFCTAVIVTGSHSFRYESIESILKHSDFPGTLDLWTQKGEPLNAKIQGNQITLQSELMGVLGGLYRKFPIAGVDSLDGEMIRVTGRVERTVDDPNAINLTRDQGTIAVLDFALDDDGGRKVDILLDITHAPPKTKLDKIVQIPSPVKAVSLGFLHREATDSSIVTNIEIQRLQERKTYLWSLLPVLTLGVLLLYQFLKLALSNFTLIRLLSLLTSGCILLVLLLPKMQSVVSKGYEKLQQTPLGVIFPASLDIFSAGHLMMFSVVAVLAWSLADSFKQAKALTLLQILLVTVASEGAQQHIGGRTASIDDLAYNFLGLLLGTTIYFLYTKYSASKKVIPNS